jgi:hypothetical protein
MGRPHRLRLPEVVRCLGEQSDSRVASAAASVLGRYKSVPLVVPTLTSCLTSDHSSLRRSAADALGSIGAPAAPALPALTNAFRHRDPNLREVAEDAIKAITRDLQTNAPPKAPSLKSFVLMPHARIAHQPGAASQRANPPKTVSARQAHPLPCHSTQPTTTCAQSGMSENRSQP